MNAPSPRQNQGVRPLCPSMQGWYSAVAFRKQSQLASKCAAEIAQIQRAPKPGSQRTSASRG